MKRPLRHPWAWTTLAPLGCAAHCAATPLLVASAPAVWNAPALEWGLLGATSGLAALALRGALRSHRQAWPFLPIALGTGIWAASLLHAFHPIPEPLTTSVAALLTATGLLWNSRLHCGRSADACVECRAAVPEGAQIRPSRFRESIIG